MLPRDAFGYDEADYMRAAQGSNYFDRGVIPISTFVGEGIARGISPETRSSLSEFIRRSEDVSFLRPPETIASRFAYYRLEPTGALSR
jgi:hypothetical protein